MGIKNEASWIEKSTMINPWRLSIYFKLLPNNEWKAGRKSYKSHYNEFNIRSKLDYESGFGKAIDVSKK